MLTFLTDSIYTKRYMGIPDLNHGGYVNVPILNVTEFHSIHFLLAHGSGDNDIYFANSAHPLDMFTDVQTSASPQPRLFPSTILGRQCMWFSRSAVEGFMSLCI